MKALGPPRVLGVACLALSLAAASAGRVSAQGTTSALGPRGALVDVRVAPDTVTVGSPFVVRIRVRAPKMAVVRFPPVPDSTDALAPIDPRAIEEAADTAVIDRTAVYRLVAWDVGTRTPRFGSISVSAAGSAQQYDVAVPPVVVLSLLPSDSASRVPRDAREPLPLPGRWWRWAFLAGLLIAGFAMLWWMRRRAAARVPAPTDPFTEATARFAALDALGLIDAGESGRHPIAHVDVMRAYVARRFPKLGASATAAELAGALDTVEFPILPARVSALVHRDAELRYAGVPLAAEEARAMAGEARAIVSDIQEAHVARLRAEDRGPAPRRRR